MDRLTNKCEADAQRKEYENRISNGYPRNIPEERLLRLAAYEDTGYMPEEIAKLQATLIVKNTELLKTREELRAYYDRMVGRLDALNSGLMDANMELAADRKDLINELCQYCGKYKQAHEGACDGCRWSKK